MANKCTKTDIKCPISHSGTGLENGREAAITGAEKVAEQKTRILIVDDDEDILVAGKLLLKRHFGTVATTNMPKHIPELVGGTPFDVILLDMNFGAGERSGREGLAWLARILEIDADAVVVLITAHSAIDTAVEAMRLGAFDFVSKPWQNEKLVATVNAAVTLRRSRNQAKSLLGQNRELAAQTSRPADIMLGESPAMKTVFQLIARAAPTDANVLVLGENGTGKELVAREIHRQSARARGVFMSVDLGAVTESLFESEMFGHKKGAFTDAREDRVGRFQAANGGTLFLDEIGNIPLHLLAKLLMVLEQRKVVPVGANEPVPIDVRVISATNISPNDLADESVFRLDLLYRLNTVEIWVPPLRERRPDIPLLVDHFLRFYARKYGRPIRRVAKATMEHIQNYAWPGNVRALRHAAERAVIMSENDTLQPEDFPLSHLNGAAPAGTAKPEGHSDTLEDLERNAIAKTLRRHSGNVSRAAKDLGITRASLYRRMEKHGL